MILVSIDIGKNSIFFCALNRNDGEALVEPSSFKGFILLLQTLTPYNKASVLEDTEHYNFALLRYLLRKGFIVALINSITTDMTRKMQDCISKND